MIRISIEELYRMMRLYNEVTDSKAPHITGYIVYSQSNWKTPYSLESRTYYFSNDNKAFKPSCGGYSIFASNLDNTDICVRLDCYNWKVSYCYISDEDYEIYLKATQSHD